MAQRIRAVDWEATALGPAQDWRPGLKAMVRLALATQHPIFIFWGEQHVCLYNDAYSASLGPEKHPRILGLDGRAAWTEIWDAIGPQIDFVLRGEGATWHENQLLPILRHGEMQEVYWTYSYGPIDDHLAASGVGGVLVICTETTQQVLAARRADAERERLAQMFAQAPSFMAMMRGPRHVFEFVNAAYTRLVGDRPLLGLPVAEAVPEAAGQGFFELLDQVYASGQPFAANGALYKVRSQVGGPLRDAHVDFVYQPITDQDGAVAGIFVVGVDVSQRVLADRALRERSEQLHLATEAAEIGLWDVDLVTDTLYWPPRVKAMFGISPEKPVTLNDFYAGLHPDDVAATTAAFARSLDSMQRATYDVEYRTIGKEDGRVRWLAAKGRGVFDAEGRCVRAIGTVLDISVRKAAQAHLLELNETLERRVADALAERKLLADIVEGTNAFVQVADLGYNWLAINRASAVEFERLYGVRPRVGDNMLALLAHRPQQQAAVRAVWGRALAGEEFTTVSQFGDPALEQHYYEMRFNVLRDKDGLRIGAYQFVYDVSERMSNEARLADAEERLRQSQKMEAIGQLTGGIAHDFNNLLQAVQGNLQLITRVPDDATRVLRWADSGLKAVRRGADLTSQLLSFAREQKLELRSIVIARLVGDMADMLHRSLGPLVRLELALHDADTAVAADATQLEMAILNLAINARDAMPDGGTLSIATRLCQVGPDGELSDVPELPPGPYVELRVADSGSGMPADVVARAFDPFFTTKGVGKGTGLGLSQVYGMVRQLGGRVSIDSQPGQGTRVCLLLPVTEAPLAVVAAAAAADSASHGRSYRVLVVDDDAAVRRFLVDALEVLGYGVTEAADGAAALRALDVIEPDLMVVDFAMPGMNGAQVARAVRDRLPGLPVVVASGYADTDLIDQTLGTTVEIVPKPYDLSQLQAVLSRLLAAPQAA